MTTVDLKTSLLDLLHAIDGSGIRLIIGGGFGLYLKMEHVRRSGMRTLLEEWPEPRSTNDLDLFLRAEILIESERSKALADALTRLGYHAVPGAENYQFTKAGPRGNTAGNVKVDLLTGPQARFRNTPVKVDTRRARPKPSVGIHAHPVDEAITLEEGLLSLRITGRLRSGAAREYEVFIPHPYTFLMMKLFAFKDRFEDSNKEFGRYHALDLYSILATTSESEWREGLKMRDRYGTDPYVMEAGSLVAGYFSSLESLGILRLKESPYYRLHFQISDFISALRELFPGTADMCH